MPTRAAAQIVARVWWWYVLTLVLVIAGVLIGRTIGDSGPFWDARASQSLHPETIVGNIVICGLVGWLYAQYARKFKDRVESLGTLREQL